MTSLKHVLKRAVTSADTGPSCLESDADQMLDIAPFPVSAPASVCFHGQGASAVPEPGGNFQRLAHDTLTVPNICIISAETHSDPTELLLSGFPRRRHRALAPWNHTAGRQSGKGLNNVVPGAISIFLLALLESEKPHPK